MKYTAILREKGSNYYVKRVDSDYSSKASYANDCRANGYYVGGIFTDAEIDLIVNGFNSDDLETWRKSLEFREKFSERIISCFTDGCPDISEPKETAEPEQKEECTQETEHSGNWFEDVFLQSLYSTAGHSEKWLTAKQTAICTQYMERCTTRIETATGYNNHDNYVYNWDGREVVLSYSKKNGCGTIWFGLNAEEQEQAQIENEAEKRQKIIETAQRRLRRSPERYYATLDKMKSKIEHYQQDIEDSKEEGDTDGLENLISYVEALKNELDLWESLAEPEHEAENAEEQEAEEEPEMQKADTLIDKGLNELENHADVLELLAGYSETLCRNYPQYAFDCFLHRYNFYSVVECIYSNSKEAESQIRKTLVQCRKDIHDGKDLTKCCKIILNRAKQLLNAIRNERLNI